MLPPNPMLRDGDEQIIIYSTTYVYGGLNEPVPDYGPGVMYLGTFTQSSGSIDDGSIGSAVNGSTAYDVMIFSVENPGVFITQAIGLVDTQGVELSGRATDAATRRGYGAWSVPVLVGGIDQDGADGPISGVGEEGGDGGGGDGLPDDFDELDEDDA